LNFSARVRAPLRHLHTLLSEEQGCLPALRSLGIDPGSIRYVLLSHLHWDHTGAVGRFPNAIHFVQRCELEYALVPDWFAADAFARSDFDVPGLAWHLLEGSQTDAYDLFGDGTVRIILTPGSFCRSSVVFSHAPKNRRSAANRRRRVHNGTLGRENASQLCDFNIGGRPLSQKASTNRP
jgi:Metallo-beta-lactamase superfamily